MVASARIDLVVLAMTVVRARTLMVWGASVVSVMNARAMLPWVVVLWDLRAMWYTILVSMKAMRAMGFTVIEVTAMAMGSIMVELVVMWFLMVTR